MLGATILIEAPGVSWRDVPLADLGSPHLQDLGAPKPVSRVRGTARTVGMVAVLAFRGVFARGFSRSWLGVLLGLAVFMVAGLAGAARAASSVYVTNFADNSVSQFDIAAGGGLSPRAPATVATGGGPQLVAVSPDGKSVYVTNYGDNSVSQFDAGADGGLSPKAPATVAAGSNPAGVAISPDGKSVYVTNYGVASNSVSQFDVGVGGGLSPKVPATVATGQKPAGVAVSPDGKSVYVTNYGAASSSVSQFDVGVGGGLSPKTPATVGGVPTPAGVVVSPDGKSVYVTNFGAGDNRVSQFDVGAGGVLEAKAPATVTAGTSPVAVAVSPDGKSVYVTNSGDNNVSQFDIGAGGMLKPKAPATVPTGKYPYGVAISPDGNSVYVTNANSNSVSQFDIGAGGALRAKATATARTGIAPLGIAVSPDRPAAGPPSATVATPADRASYSLHANVNASYSCSPGANGGVLKAGATGCSAVVASGSAIDTATLGAHTFDVTATDTDGQTATATSHYTVTGPPPPTPAPRNLTLPSIVQSYSCPQVGGCKPVPHTYECRPGTWQGRDSARPYSFTWWRLTPDRGYLGGYRADQAATGESYRPSVSDVFGLVTQSWLFRCVVEASNSGGSTRATSPSTTLNPALDQPQIATNETVNLRVSGIEVTQAIQTSSCVCTGTLPSRDQLNTNTPGQADYQGLRMAAGQFTVVRVFANFTQPADLSSVQGATARLEVLDSNGERISLLSPDSSPAALSQPDCGLCVSLKERANPGASFNFLIPWQETEHRALSFRATVRPPAGLTAPRQCAGCKANTFLLSDVPFVSTATVPIHPIPLTVGGVRTNKTENQVFGDAQTVLPVNVQIFPYAAPLAVDGMDNTQAAAAIAQRVSDPHGYLFGDPTQYPIGVFYTGEAALRNGLTLAGRILYGSVPPISVVDDSRPLTSVAHELSHGLGLVHADTGSPSVNPPDNKGPHPDGTPDCGGNSGGQVGQPWPPDNEGRLLSIGFDRRKWDVFRTGSLPRTFVEGYDPVGKVAPGTRYYDFMSYCPFGGVNESLDWISARNWNQLIAFHPPTQALPAAADHRARAASGTPLRVIATVDPAGNTSIFDVAPGQRTAGGPTAGSPYRVELRDGAGSLLTSVVPDTSVIHVDGQPAQRPGLLLEATLPFIASTAAVVVSSDGRELTRRARSPHAPTAAILTPRSGSRVGAARTTLVRWSAHDADSDRLTATVDYSPDGGRHWKVVAGDAHGSSVRVPSRALSASRNGKLRVRISDGFNVATPTTGRLHVAGAPPLVHIITTGRGHRVQANTTLLLQGAAFDDAGRRLTGRHLKWYAGRRLLGRGELLTVQGLPPKRTAIRLVATDTHGRSAHARLVLNVVPVRPAFLIAKAPTHVASKARKIRIVVASTVPAVLKIAGARHPVDRKPRTITITVRPGRSTLHLKYSLTSRGGITRATYIATR